MLVHGDDFTLSGCDEDLKCMASVFEQKYKTKVRGIMGPDPEDDKAMTILNRSVEWYDGGVSRWRRTPAFSPQAPRIRTSLEEKRW